MLDDTLTLPLLRDELRIEEAPFTTKEGRRWRLYDPITHQFFLLEEADISLLALWNSGSVGALKATMQRMNLAFNELQLEGLLSFLVRHELLRSHSSSSLQNLQEKYLASHHLTGWKNTLDKFRSFRQPMFFMEPLLRQIDPLFRIVGHRSFAMLWLLITTIGVYFSARQWDDFINTADGLFNLKGMIAFGITLFILKCLHELGHAYLAHYYGCKVGRIGLATFLFFPMLYTELDDVSRLNSAKQKMLIAAGGVLTEILIAGIATFFWAVLSDGLLRSLAFMVATTCWTTSLLINLNPFAKFDGYYILSDFLKIENLQTRALAWSNWFLDRIVIGKTLLPLDNVSLLAASGLIVFGVCTWLYQVILLTSVSYLLYAMLLPALGIALFAAVFMTYVMVPAFRRAVGLWKEKSSFSLMRRTLLSLFLIGLLCLFFLPINHTLHLPSVMRSEQVSVIRAPENAMILSWYVAQNQRVSKGQLIVAFSSPELDKKIKTAQIAFNLAKARLSRVAGGSKQRELILVLKQEFEQAKMRLEGLISQARRLKWEAPDDGLLVDVPVQLQPGQWVSPNQSLGRIIASNHQEGIAFISEKELRRLSLGAQARFYPDDPSWHMSKAKVVEIDPSAVEQLTIDELNEAYGGSIPTKKDKDGRAIPTQALHQIRFTVYPPSMNHQSQVQLSGEVVIEAAPESLAAQVWRNFWGLLLTELRR